MLKKPTEKASDFKYQIMLGVDKRTYFESVRDKIGRFYWKRIHQSNLQLIEEDTESAKDYKYNNIQSVLWLIENLGIPSDLDLSELYKKRMFDPRSWNILMRTLGKQVVPLMTIVYSNLS